MNAKQKYLKDENGQVISPVVSTDTVYDASGNTLGGELYQLVQFYLMRLKPLH